MAKRPKPFSVPNPAGGSLSTGRLPCAKGSLFSVRARGRKVKLCCPKGYFTKGRCSVSMREATRR